MAEEAERPVREVDDRGDNNERHNPVAKVIKHGQAGAYEQLDEVITRPVHDTSDTEAGSTSKASISGSNQISHNGNDLIIVYNGDRLLTSCRT